MTLVAPMSLMDVTPIMPAFGSLMTTGYWYLTTALMPEDCPRTVSPIMNMSIAPLTKSVPSVVPCTSYSLATVAWTPELSPATTSPVLKRPAGPMAPSDVTTNTLTVGGG